MHVLLLPFRWTNEQNKEKQDSQGLEKWKWITAWFVFSSFPERISKTIQEAEWTTISYDLSSEYVLFLLWNVVKDQIRWIGSD